ncbi:MAG: metallophosphoesterase, partial [Planctomycetota bacterium]
LGMFKDRPNVKLALSGHMHLIDRVDIRQTSFICDGAVSGSWWQGDYHGFDEGYGLVDLYDDGSFEHQYVAYNWKV